MARKDPYDPEEGIIDLFDIVDDPEASPEPEPELFMMMAGSPAGAARSGRSGNPAREESERVVSRYPFENSDDFLEEIEKTPLMTLLPPKGRGFRVAGGACFGWRGRRPAESGEPVRERAGRRR